MFIPALFQIWKTPCSIITYYLWQYQPSVACGELISEYDHLRVFGPEVSWSTTPSCDRTSRVRFIMLWIMCSGSWSRCFSLATCPILMRLNPAKNWVTVWSYQKTEIATMIWKLQAYRPKQKIIETKSKRYQIKTRVVWFSVQVANT